MCRPASAHPPTPCQPAHPHTTGKGAYGTVYKAFDRVLGQTVAVKVIKVSEQDQDELERIHHEITMLAECNHPNIVKYLVGMRSPQPASPHRLTHQHHHHDYVASGMMSPGSTQSLLHAHCRPAALTGACCAALCCAGELAAEGRAVDIDGALQRGQRERPHGRHGDGQQPGGGGPP
jgi:hypothetical protein